jgi:uncharacterized protein
MKYLKILLAIFFVTSLSFAVFAQNVDKDIPEKPNPPRLVNDYAGLLNSGEANQLELKLRAFNDSTSTQIVVVIVKSLGMNDKAEFATKLGEKWGVGQKGKNNGVVILIKTKTAEEKGQAFIAPGYGLEGAIPDAVAKRIIENALLPNFREGNYYQGIDAAVNTLISLSKGEFTADAYMKGTHHKQEDRSVGPLAIFIIIFIIIIFSIIGRFRSARQYSIGHNIPFWVAMSMLAASRSDHHSGSFGDFSSGSGGFGGGGGSDFGGFGGGSFGGGGAGGSW